MKVLVCGSRSFADPFRVSLAINERIGRLPRGTCVLSGNARGADAMAEEAATRYDHNVLLFPADWETHGKKAGIIRNLKMLDQQPDLVIAFWNGTSRGTQHTITEARKRRIPVEVIAS